MLMIPNAAWSNFLILGLKFTPWMLGIIFMVATVRMCVCCLVCVCVGRIGEGRVGRSVGWLVCPSL